MSIVDLNAERNKRERPDPEHVMTDEFGREMFEFICDYTMDGSKWGVHIWAYSQEDAENRIAAMRDSLTFAGQIYCTVPA